MTIDEVVGFCNHLYGETAWFLENKEWIYLFTLRSKWLIKKSDYNRFGFYTLFHFNEVEGQNYHPQKRSHEEGHGPHPDVQVLVRSDQRHPSEPYDQRRRERHAGVFPSASVRRQQHALQEADHASHRSHRPRVHHRLRLEELLRERHGLRHQTAGGP